MNSYLASSGLASFGPALANHLWQSTAFGLLAWLLTLALRRNQARVRYAVWMAASIKFLVPFALLVSAGNLLPHPVKPLAPVVYSTMSVVEEPFVMDTKPFVAAPIHIPTVRERVEAALPAALSTVWLLGFGAVLFAWGNRWRVVARSVREAVPATEGRELEVLRRLGGGDLPLLLSAERMEPGVFGVVRPVLVWPVQLSAELDDHHVEAIVAHELTHVRRRDNLTASLHMLVEAAFWFHPVVWWVERQMVKEREQACDEAVVAMGGSAETYAESLLKTCWFCIESPLTCVSGVTGADLKRRVADIISGRSSLQMTWPVKMLLAVTAVSVVVVPVVLGQQAQGGISISSGTTTLRYDVVSVKENKSGAYTSSVQFEDGDMLKAENANVMMAAFTLTTALHAQTPATPAPHTPSFEVATIKPVDTCTSPRYLQFTPSGRMSIGCQPLTVLIRFAYLPRFQEGNAAGGPAWADSELYDLVAKVDQGDMAGWATMTSDQQLKLVQPMLQHLLADRFHLKTHTEQRPAEVYALVQAKGGAKLKETAQPALNANGELEKDSNGVPIGGFKYVNDRTRMIARAEQLQNLAWLFGARSGHEDLPTINRTGLDSFYDFEMTFPPDVHETAEFEHQMNVQLGLRIERQKVQLQTIMIDHADKPSDNN